MTVLLVAGVVAAVVGMVILAVALVRTSQATDPHADAMDRRMADLMAAQQALVGKIDVVSQQQVAGSKALTDTVTENQQRLTRDIKERLHAVESARVAKHTD